MSEQDIKPLRLAIFISGRGSNMEALIKACEEEAFPAKISVVLSNNPDARGLALAKSAGLNTEVIDHRQFPEREGFERAMVACLDKYNIDLICLAGFMRILSPYFIDQWPEKIINIHPSLLPKYKGLDTHQRAIDAGEDEAGCTVHYVVPDVDSGEIIVQKSVPVENGDDADTLAQRVLVQEHVAYPEAVKIIAKKRQKDVQ